MSDLVLSEQQLIKEAIEHPGVKLLFQKLHIVRDIQAANQLSLDPYSQAAEIKRVQEFRYVVDVLFPGIIESLINFDPESITKQVSPKKRFSFLSWFTR